MTLPLEVLAILALCFRCGNAFLITQHNEPHNSLTASVHDVHKRKMIRLKSQEKSYAFMALDDATQLWENDVSAFVYLIPPVAAAGAFNGYEATAATFHRFVDVLSNNNWAAVDGGSLKLDVITPAINGPFLASITVLFATLTATTIQELYNRQLKLRDNLVYEVDALRTLSLAIASLPDPYRSEAVMHMVEYVDYFYLDAKTGFRTPVSRRQSGMDQITVLLHRASNESMNGSGISVPGLILGECYRSVAEINTQRVFLVNGLKTTFPPMHYFSLALLATAICFVFFVETDRELLFFLAGFQLRVIWSLLVGVFATMGVVFYDLATPFSGSYKVFEGTDDLLKSTRDFILNPVKHV